MVDNGKIMLRSAKQGDRGAGFRANGDLAVHASRHGQQGRRVLAHTYDGWVGQALAARSIWRRAATRSLPRSAAPSRATAVRVTAAESTTGTPVGCAPRRRR